MRIENKMRKPIFLVCAVSLLFSIFLLILMKHAEANHGPGTGLHYRCFAEPYDSQDTKKEFAENTVQETTQETTDEGGMNLAFSNLHRLAQNTHEHTYITEKSPSSDNSLKTGLENGFKYPLFLGLCCGKCGGNMPLNIPGSGVPEPHEFRIKTNFSWGRMEGLKEGTRRLSNNDAQKEYMMIPREMDMLMSNVSVGYAFSDRFFAGIMGMYMKKDMRMLNRMDESSRMKSEGLGDTMIMTKTLLYADDPLIPTNQISLLLGLSLPTGSVDEDRKGSVLPYSMQLGSGTFDPFIGILYEGSRTPFWWGSNISYLPRLYENYREYHLGDEFRFDLYGMYQVRYDLLAELQLNGKYQGNIVGQDKAFESGTGHVMNNPDLPFMSNLFDPDNYGGTTIDITTGIQWQPVPNHILNIQFSFPIFQNLHGTQLERDFKVALTYYVEFPLSKSRRSSKKDKGLDILGF